MTYPLMRARHAVLDVVAEVPDNDYYRGLGWSKVDESTPTTAEADAAEAGRAFLAEIGGSETPGLYDPADHNADDVIAYLAGADPGEAQRVLDAERAGKNRVTVLNAAPED